MTITFPNEIIKFKKRNPETDKTDYGNLLILCGSAEYTGAPFLCAEGASKCGVGLITLAVPSFIFPILAHKCASVIVKGIGKKEDEFFHNGMNRQINEYLNFSTAAVIGCGLARKPKTVDFVLNFCKRGEIPLVVDADGLFALSAKKNIPRRKAPTIFTPHKGEFARLLNTTKDEIKKNPKSLAVSFAKKNNVILVLKGNKTIVTDGTKIFVNPTGNAGMAKGGTGDVLSGMIGGLLAQGFDAYRSSCTAVFLHGLAGDIAKKELTEIALTPEDIIKKIPSAFKKILNA